MLFGRIIPWIHDAVYLQLMLTGVSLPFLLWWQMPFPLLSIVGNIIHPIFLTLFLTVSSLLFFATLLHIPTKLLCWTLNNITELWNTILVLPVPSAWMLLRWWHLILLYLCAGIIYVWKTRPRQSPWMPRICTIAILITIASIYYTSSAGITILHRQEQSLICIPHSNGTLELIDHGFIGHAANIPALINYELMPHILTHYGKPKTLTISGNGARIKRARQLLNLL